MIKLKSLLIEKTLYHGTIIDHVKSIEKYGLIPSVGEFVRNAYGGSIDVIDNEISEYFKELVFATDKEQLEKAVTSITAQVGIKLNKDFHDVTDEEFVKNGALVIIKDGESIMNFRPENDEKQEYPYTVEPRDFYSDDTIGVDYVLTGKKMISVLKRYKAWPRYHVFGNIDMKYKKDYLIKQAIKRNPKKSKDEILKIVNSWNEEIINKYYRQIKQN